MTTHQLYQRHASALGIDSYGTFCKLLELLDAPALGQVLWKDEWNTFTNDAKPYTLAFCLVLVHEMAAARPDRQHRIVLLDGTVVREWPIDEYDGIF